MSRSVGWVSHPSDIVKSSLEKAKRSSYFIIRELGPTSFTIKDATAVREQQAEGTGGSSAKRVYKVTLGSVHSCTCLAFRQERALCRHLCWVLLKKFRLPDNHPFTYQSGLVPREIDELLSGTHIKERPPTARRTPPAARQESSENINRRQLEEDDVCPICQEELLEVRLPVTWCRACSNAAHIRCMKVWAEHQETMSRGDNGAPVLCPYCRQEFAPREQLRREFSNTWERKKAREVIFTGVACAECGVTPIKGKLYLATRSEIRLCGQCYRNGAKPNLKFNVKEKPGQSLKPAKRNLQTQNLALELQGREITEGDYETLLNLDRPASPDAPGVPEHILNLITCHRVGVNRRLLREGVQCRLCLQPYQPEDYVKKLPKCNHYFHRDCIDTWLQNHRECPIDGQSIRLRQKAPKKTSVSLTDIIDNRHRSAGPSGRPKPRLLARRATTTNLNTELDSLLITRPAIAQNKAEEEIEEIDPIPLINFRMRNLRIPNMRTPFH